jgi:hypothetical protein
VTVTGVEAIGSGDKECRGDPPVVALVQDVTNNSKGSKARKLGEIFPRRRFREADPLRESGFFSIIEFSQKIK